MNKFFCRDCLGIAVEPELQVVRYVICIILRNPMGLGASALLSRALTLLKALTLTGRGLYIPVVGDASFW